MTRYGMAIDTKRCYACNKCSMACKVEHNLPEGVLWSQAHTEGGDFHMTPAGTYPNDLHMTPYTLACQHCDVPACFGVCPTGATSVRDDGIVVVDYEVCIGCKFCIEACSYEGVRALIENPTYLVDWRLGDVQVPDVQDGTMAKCTFCVERIDRGEQPICVEVCHMSARIFGDLDDPESDISKAIASREYDQLQVDQGTGPRIYYLK